MFGSFLPSLWSSTHHSLLGSKEPTLLCNHWPLRHRRPDDTVSDAFQLDANYNRPMGTSSDWISDLLRALWFPSFMLLGVWILKGKPQIRPIPTPLNLLSWAFGGLFSGIWLTFGWNAFRWPLVSLLLAVRPASWPSGSWLNEIWALSPD